jgi:hypothetical protein
MRKKWLFVAFFLSLVFVGNSVQCSRKPQSIGEARRDRIEKSYDEAQKTATNWSNDSIIVAQGFANLGVPLDQLAADAPLELWFEYISKSKNRMFMVYYKYEYLSPETLSPGKIRKTTKEFSTDMSSMPKQLKAAGYGGDDFRGDNYLLSWSLRGILIGLGSNYQPKEIDKTSAKIDLVKATQIAEKEIGGEARGRASEFYTGIGVLLKIKELDPKWYFGYTSDMEDNEFSKCIVINAKTGKVVEERDLSEKPLTKQEKELIYWWMK